MDKVPNKTWTDIRDSLPPIERILLYGTALMLVLFFAVTFLANPSISGFSVAGAVTSEEGRFSGSTSILLVIFAAFAFFIFLITKRLGMGKQI